MDSAVATPFANFHLHHKFHRTFRRHVHHVRFLKRYVDNGFAIARNPESDEWLLHELKECSNLTVTSQ